MTTMAMFHNNTGENRNRGKGTQEQEANEKRGTRARGHKDKGTKG